MAKKKLNRKYPNGVKEVKKKPIYVESDKDSRYVAYQDSLALHNASEIGRRGSIVNPFNTPAISNEAMNAISLGLVGPNLKDVKKSAPRVAAFNAIRNKDRYSHESNPNIVVSNSPSAENTLIKRDSQERDAMINALKEISFPVAVGYHATPDVMPLDIEKMNKYYPTGSYVADHPEGDAVNFYYKKPEQEVRVKPKLINASKINLENAAENSVNNTSLVELMKERGLDSSFDSRKKLYESYGLEGEFKGTREQGDMLTRKFIESNKPKMSGGNESEFDNKKLKYPNGVKEVKKKPKVIKRPIVVDSEDDPRHQAYSDSLNLSNASDYIRNNLVGKDLKNDRVTKREWNYDNSGTLEFSDEEWEAIRKDPNDEYNPDSRLAKEVTKKFLSTMTDRARMTNLSSTDPLHKTIQPHSYYIEQPNDITSGTFGYENPIYKKPEQPVLVKGTPEYDEWVKSDIPETELSRPKLKDLYRLIDHLPAKDPGGAGTIKKPSGTALDDAIIPDVDTPKFANGIQNVGGGLQGAAGMLMSYGHIKGGDNRKLGEAASILGSTGSVMNTFGNEIEDAKGKVAGAAKLAGGDPSGLTNIAGDVNKLDDPYQGVDMYNTNTMAPADFQDIIQQNKSQYQVTNPGNPTDAQLDAIFNGVDITKDLPKFRQGRRGLMAKYGCYMKPKGKKK